MTRRIGNDLEDVVRGGADPPRYGNRLVLVVTHGRLDAPSLRNSSPVRDRIRQSSSGMRSWHCVWGRRVSAPVEVPEDIVERIRTLCLALPEVTVRVDYSRTRARSTAQSFDIRRRSFCLLVAVEDSAGKPVTLLVLRADPDEREVLLSIGHPFFASRAGRDRIGVVLTDDTDWEEIRELVTESYRVLAPKKLTALLD
jgi:predicted DNA-binding protein (MmcQ/YjbR family)